MTLLTALLGVAGAPRASAATVDLNGWYVLVNRNSGKAMEDYNYATDDRAAVVQWTRHDGTNQQWRFLDSGGGYYRLQNRHSGKVLDNEGWSTTAGSNLVQWSDQNAANQQFRPADSADGRVRLINRHSGMAAELKDGSTADGTRVTQSWDWDGSNQQWQLVRVGNVSGSSLPSSFQWRSSGVLAGPKPNARHDTVAIKDFSVVRHNNEWLIYASAVGPSFGYGLEFFKFSDWSQAASAPQTYLDEVSPMGPGYRAAPQVFYFAPQNLWYMVYQTGPPTYSTSTDPSNPASWSAPKTFIADEPPIVQQYNGGWLDFWVTCDTANCHLFFTNNRGQLFRAQTSLGNFPNGFGNTTVAMSDSASNLFEATNVYKVSGTDQYLLLVEAMAPSNGRRYFRSFTSNSLAGTWTPLAASESSPFAGAKNVTFSGTPWTQDISHGDMVRINNDQTNTISPCNLQYVYQGLDPNSSGDYNSLPWRMGLLTQTNSTC
ncbi:MULTISPECIES: non-reducing end alpha-L-arabinofuranosidase family hydrolase [Streptomyces]|uniref:non-reducing end alpha-L-arabinofuranosidase n=1 Tax=Streptomyces sviceus (strain ATCC 29083 / DSM 924 / JCM 4929 / NBRC 13980 / NCIMB 11184 / NRRL 5439 / UC 5370) TaxID=463191 RepID=B5I3U6_STRX2|nr:MULTISPECIES: non-reducing end alpha-L-arabinofuranosidase family hydrolase [Streptomyces]EDY59751.1 alpha-L-arabinofuranosidase [Streptomyces sviceus ATCC 29083]